MTTEFISIQFDPQHPLIEFVFMKGNIHCQGEVIIIVVTCLFFFVDDNADKS